MNKALCVGINKYPNPANNLNGCVNDANDWMNLLIEYGFTVERLLDSRATKENILTRLGELIYYAEPGDVIVFTYSGHGTQVADKSGDEADYYDEALYVYDTTITDDEFRKVIDGASEGVTVYFILDSCFSGTMTRALLDKRIKPRYIETDKITWRMKPRSRFLKEEEMKELLLTGSAEDEYSYDAYLDGRYNGAMTYHAIKEIKKNAIQTWENFFKNLRLALPNPSFPQTPQLEGKQELKENQLFKGEEIIEQPPVVPPIEEETPIYIIVIGSSTVLLILLYLLLQGIIE